MLLSEVENMSAPQEFKCPNCGATFKTKDELDTHLKTCKPKPKFLKKK